MRRVITSTLCLTAAALLVACAKKQDAGGVAPADAPPAAAAPAAPAVTALVALGPTKDHTTSGTLNLEFADGVVEVTGQISGLTADADHGIHVHEKGDCKAPDASSAGEHFNPTTQPHGSPDAPAHHVGDMLNIHADAMGNAMVDLKLQGMTLKDGSPNDIKGKAIVVHEKADDYTTQPAGNSGARLACGVIG
jgi:Cu-Zn family superoxide dismutase